MEKAELIRHLDAANGKLGMVVDLMRVVVDELALSTESKFVSGIMKWSVDSINDSRQILTSITYIEENEGNFPNEMTPESDTPEENVPF